MSKTLRTREIVFATATVAAIAAIASAQPQGQPPSPAPSAPRPSQPPPRPTESPPTQQPMPSEQPMPPTDQMNMAVSRNPQELKLAPVPGVPTCANGAAETGDPMKTAFVLLAKSKSNCVIPWHWHTATENVTIVSGTVRMEMRDGSKPVTMKAGGFSHLPSRHVHQFTCIENCMFFIHSDGAFDIHYVDPTGEEIPADEALKPFKESTVPMGPT